MSLLKPEIDEIVKRIPSGALFDSHLVIFQLVQNTGNLIYDDPNVLSLTLYCFI